jgi:hypothetical protein
MTTPQETTPGNKQQNEGRKTPIRRSAWLWNSIQLLLALVITTLALIYLLNPPFKGAVTESQPTVAKSSELAQMVSPGVVSIKQDSALSKKLTIAKVTTERISAPVLIVTGSVVARLRPGNDPAEDRWQFNTPDLLTAYTDWRKSNGDVELAEKQLKEIRELTNDRISTQKKLVDRLRKLVDAGTDAPKDLAAEEGNLRQATIQGRKDVIEAENALRSAIRNRAGLERQLSQAGADPHLLGVAPESTAVVMADVPEARLSLVRQGQACQARFYGFPDQVFNGKVSSLAPTISKERRTLRVLFELSDTQGRLKPGMFADVGLGTDLRDALLASSEGVIHVGQSDYMFIGTVENAWKITEVIVGEQFGGKIEVLQGLKSGDKVIGNGAILLKPFVVQFVQVDTKPIPAPAKSDQSQRQEGKAGS